MQNNIKESKKQDKQSEIREASKTFYDSAAWSFSQTRNYCWDDLNFTKEYVKNQDKVLDFGCGNGRLSELFKEKNYEYTGVDISNGLLKIAKEKYPDKKFVLINKENELPFEDRSFDKIFSIAVFHHFNPEMAGQALRELKRVLKKNGVLVLTAWYLWSTKYKKKFLEKKSKGEDNLMINLTFKDSQKTYYRPCYFWKKGELDKIVEKSGFQIEKSGFTFSKKGGKRNLYLVCKK